MKIEAFTDKVAEMYGSTDEQTIVDEGAAFIADLVNVIQKQIQTKVGANVRLIGDGGGRVGTWRRTGGTDVSQAC